jgi:hypothetical protein
MTLADIHETCHLNFHSSISQSRNDRSFSDVLIRAGDKEFYCHAVHLAGRSDYFKAALDKVWIKKREDGLAELDLSQFEEETVESMIEFIYTGKVDFAANGEVSKIAEAADYLLMPDLFELCLARVGETPSEAVAMFAMAFNLGKTRLAVECISIFPADWTEINSICGFDEEMIQFVILSLRIPDTDRWTILLKWTEARCANAPDSRLPLLYNVFTISLIILGSRRAIRKHAPVLFQFSELEFDTLVKPVIDSIVDVNLKDTFFTSVEEFRQLSRFVSFQAISMSKIIYSPQVFKQISEYLIRLTLLGLFFKSSEEMILPVK